jgi:hypothetical protein
MTLLVSKSQIQGLRCQRFGISRPISRPCRLRNHFRYACVAEKREGWLALFCHTLVDNLFQYCVTLYIVGETKQVVRGVASETKE